MRIPRFDTAETNIENFYSKFVSYFDEEETLYIKIIIKHHYFFDKGKTLCFYMKEYLIEKYEKSQDPFIASKQDLQEGLWIRREIQKCNPYKYLYFFDNILRHEK